MLQRMSTRKETFTTYNVFDKQYLSKSTISEQDSFFGLWVGAYTKREDANRINEKIVRIRPQMML